MIEIIVKDNLKQEDIKSLFKIHEEVFLENDKMSYECFKSEFDEKNRVYFVAKKDSKLIGYIGAVNCVDFFEIIGIAVKKDYQNLGYATNLLNYLFNYAKKLKIKEIFLEVDEKNYIAQNFYKKNNFFVTNIRKKYYKDSDAIVMKCINF